MSKREKKMFRWFTMVDFEEEEEFLREQHKKGWKFQRFVLPGVYVFEECKPEDMVYRLDYSGVQKNAKEEYLQIFRDCKWEYLFDVNGWSYFRKPAEEDEGKNDIFSDIETKIALLERVRIKMLPLLAIFLCCIIPQIAIQYEMSVSDNRMRLAGTVFLIIFIMMFFLYSYMFIRFGWRLKKLKEKYLEGGR